ncbi:predicted protein, partial [Nematostella vectensis]
CYFVGGTIIAVTLTVLYGSGVNFTFHLKTIPEKDCNHPSRTTAINKFGRRGKTSSAFKNALLPEYNVRQSFTEAIGECSAKGNTPPLLLTPVGTIAVQANHGFIYRIPYDTFFDREYGNTRNLDLRLRAGDRSRLPPGSWVTLEEAEQEIYIMPDEKLTGSHKFVLVAVDPADNKMKTHDVITIK